VGHHEENLEAIELRQPLGAVKPSNHRLTRKRARGNREGWLHCSSRVGAPRFERKRNCVPQCAIHQIVASSSRTRPYETGSKLCILRVIQASPLTNLEDMISFLK